MKKYFTLKFASFVALCLCCAVFLLCATAAAADWGDLLSRLDSRDFSAEKDTLSGVGSVYVGETSNPHAETVMFKARDEFRKYVAESRDSDERRADLCAFILDGVKSDVSLETKVWLLTELGALGGDAEVPALVELLKGDERRLVDASAAALAKIPGDAATAALRENAAIPAAAAALVVRDAPILPADSVETEMPLALSNASEEQVAEWLAGYDRLDDEMKARTLAGLTARDDKKFRPYALEALKSDSETLERAGFLALEKMATADDVDVFIARLDSERDLAIRLAGFVVADRFDEALKARLDAASDPLRFIDLATILVNRGVDIKPEIFARTTAAACEYRLSHLQRAAQIATTDDIPNLVASTLLFERGKDRDAAENLVAGVCGGDAAPLVALLDKYPPAAIFPMICRCGGDAGADALERGLKSSDPALQAAALAALPAWADARFAETMMTMLTDGSLSDAQAVPILRAYIRVMSLPDDKIGIKISRDEKLANLKKAYLLAKRPDEKRLILSRLAANRTEKSLDFAVECAADPEVAEAAYAAIADHAHDTALRKQLPEKMIGAINLVIENCKSNEVVERVKVYKGRME